MQLKFQFEVPGRAVAWHLSKQNGRMFLNSETRRFKDAVRAMALKARSGKQIIPKNHEVELQITIFLSYSSTFRMQNDIGQWRKRVPDLSNCAKLIEDALSGICYHDDIATASIHLQRWRVKNREEEKVLIRVFDLDIEGENSNAK